MSRPVFKLNLIFDVEAEAIQKTLEIANKMLSELMSETKRSIES
jgi:signal transduction histidine kinase